MTSRAQNSPRCTFIPPWLTERLAPDQLPTDQTFRRRRTEQAELVRRAPAAAALAGPGGWQVHDAGGTTTLPGSPARATGEPATGDPAVSLPLATTAAGLPQGMMLAAGWGQEDTLLELALELEQAAPWARIDA